MRLTLFSGLVAFSSLVIASPVSHLEVIDRDGEALDLIDKRHHCNRKLFFFTPPLSCTASTNPFAAKQRLLMPQTA